MSIKIGEIAARVVDRVRAGEAAFHERQHATPIMAAFPLSEVERLANADKKICVIARVFYDNGLSFIDRYEAEATDEAILNLVDDILSSADGAVDISLMAA